MSHRPCQDRSWGARVIPVRERELDAADTKATPAAFLDELTAAAQRTRTAFDDTRRLDSARALMDLIAALVPAGERRDSLMVRPFLITLLPQFGPVFTKDDEEMRGTAASAPLPPGGPATRSSPFPVGEKPRTIVRLVVAIRLVVAVGLVILGPRAT